MTRETKIGMLVASTFLLLVGGVVTYKIYVLDEGMPAVAENSPGAQPSTETPPQSPVPTSASQLVEPPAPEAPVITKNNLGDEDRVSTDLIASTLQQVHDGGTQLLDLSGQALIYMLSKKGNPETANANTTNQNAPMPPALAAAPTLVPPTQQGADSTSQRPAAPPTPEPAAMQPPNGQNVASRDGAKPMNLAPPPPEEAVSQRPEVTKTENKPPAQPPMSEPPTVVANQPSKPGAPNPVETKQPEMKSTATTSGTSQRASATLSAPLPASTTYDRKFDVPPAKLQPPAVAVNGGIPVTIRQQPDLPVQPPAPVVQAPAPARNPAAAKPGGGSAAAQVQDYDVLLYDIKPGDSYASISQASYGAEKYQAALAAFNRDVNPGSATLVSGLRLRVPPKEVLERRYRSLIPDLPEATPEAVAKAAPPPETARQPARLMPNLGSPQTGSALGSPVARLNPAATSAKDAAQADWTKDTKPYHVQPNDTIWSIAKHTLGKGERWPEISRLNRDVLPDVSQIKAGMVLRLPADAKVDTAETPQ